MLYWGHHWHLARIIRLFMGYLESYTKPIRYPLMECWTTYHIYHFLTPTNLHLKWMPQNNCIPKTDECISLYSSTISTPAELFLRSDMKDKSSDVGAKIHQSRQFNLNHYTIYPLPIQQRTYYAWNNPHSQVSSISPWHYTHEYIKQKHNCFHGSRWYPIHPLAVPPSWC